MAYLFPIGFVLGLAVYSWYWQATITIHARYRISSLIWSLLLLVIAFETNILATNNRLVAVFIASFILMSIVDGFGGISPERVIVSGYFKRAVKYTELAKITLIPVPLVKRPTMMVIFTTLKNQSYYLRFNKTVEELIPLLHSQTSEQVEIEIQNFE